MERELVYGVHPVREVLMKGARACRFMLVARSPKDAAVKELLALARDRGVEVRMVGKDEVERAAPGGNHQGVAVDTEALEVRHIEDALGASEAGNSTLWLGLDGITDPQNFGAILRSAACFGAEAVLTTERRSAAVTPLVQKIASGAAEHILIVDAGNLNQAIRRLKDRGFWVYAAAAKGRPLAEVRVNGPAFLVIGAEGAGVRKRTRELSDELVAIPQAPGGVASLNASCAAAVLLFEFARRLGTFEAARPVES